MTSAATSGTASATTRRFALSPSEWVTTSVAAVVSTTAYLTAGYPYLARGVVGDLLGFALLAAAGIALCRRLKHEAAVCLALIGVVVLIWPRWPLALPEAAWWALFFVGLAGYLAVRKRICD
jgi:uncharacterized membrane protein